MRRGLLLKGDLTRPTCKSWAAGAGGWPEGKGASHLHVQSRAEGAPWVVAPGGTHLAREPGGAQGRADPASPPPPAWGPAREPLSTSGSGQGPFLVLGRQPNPK